MTHSNTQSPEFEESTSIGRDGAAAKLQYRRSRYAARACKECKRRKVKCSGETPCHHCNRSETDCVYTKKPPTQAQPSQEMDELRAQLSILQQQVSLLVSREPLPTNGSTTEALPISALLSPPPSLLPASHFQGNQSPMYPESLESDGTKTSASFESAATTSLPAASAMGNAWGESAPPSASRAVTCHPLLSLSQAEAMRLIDTYDDECGSVYPFIDIESLRHFAARFYHSVSASNQAANWRPYKLDQSLSRLFSNLEMVLAIALVIGSRGSNALGSALMDELESEIDHRPSGVAADIPLMEILTLMSLYQFYRDEEVLAWRTIGLAARIALEKGFHLRDPPFATFTSAEDRERANRLFWSIYCLDRRWSFGTGLPFAIQEDDIDPGLPEPNDSRSDIFASMISYSRIGYKILKTSTIGKSDETAFLTYQVLQWYDSLEPELRVDRNEDLVLEGLSPARNRLRILNCLRRNQLRMLIHRTLLFTPASITAAPSSARTAVDLAKDTINLLDRLRTTSAVYSSHAACFNYFLYSALTVILLAVYHAKAQFYEYCREEFHMALNLIGGASAKSNIARKLWKMIKHLKVIGPDTGVLPLPYMEAPTHSGHSREERASKERSESGLASNDVDLHTARLIPSTGATAVAGNSIAYEGSGFFMGDYATFNGSILSSELSDLYQAIDPSRFGQMAASPQLLTAEQHWSQPPPFQAPQNFLPSARSVF
ncbi:uncharacterized protein PV06_05543 [Exophiala oligosperma]|uniref:Zn(2)-C6 fungal-type domain-containing protein n=1 Tax=Exophiala oligosperma TaxID=215243 RepID=A0A0D2E2D3_9EURO|nr:uncharacterized protein PV06_05543 [Exophiala oligosperma]KIW41949.1 hypothetical protein PV06_05543 [Exophiala oligosperma]